jgi:hypothetical protein
MPKTGTWFDSVETKERLPVRQYLAIAAIRKYAKGLSLRDGVERKLVAPREKWLEWAENCEVRFEEEGGAEEYAREMWEVWVGEVKSVFERQCFFYHHGQKYGKDAMSLDQATQRFNYLMSNIEYGEDSYIDTMTNGYGWAIDAFVFMDSSGDVHSVDIIYPDGLWDEIREYVVKREENKR